MIYSAFSLNGTWKMGYQEEIYTSDQLPAFKGENTQFERVEIALRQHIGVG